MTQQPNASNGKRYLPYTDPEFLAMTASSAMAKRQALMGRQQPNYSETLDRGVSAGNELTRQQFARLAGPIRNYFISNGVDELTAGLQAANITEAQRGAVEAIIQDEILKARKSEWDLAPTEPHEQHGNRMFMCIPIRYRNSRLAQLNQPNTNKEIE